MVQLLGFSTVPSAEHGQIVSKTIAYTLLSILKWQKNTSTYIIGSVDIFVLVANRLMKKIKASLRAISASPYPGIKQHCSIVSLHLLLSILPTSLKAKERRDVRKTLHAFYQLVKDKELPEFIKAIGTFDRWETEIINAFIYPHLSNGFVEGINNRTKVIKRTSYDYRSFARFRAKILAQHFIKDFDISVG
ncbi:hypothetical protein BMT55_16730 [Listeria newyorkensis]|uniref:Transposase IS204/IS1001/IS1096/IS1165 DDE domain-containing protein n=2 Tax=Listeriaceae TaxID=186820 RepID=A0ABX4XHH9_9LIST|nr:hypothetical protein EP58_10930 [Listeria newyorkensis]PNP86905.1 hypothetical protein BMT55_16730 [Listeria newyorkensis]